MHGTDHLAREHPLLTAERRAVIDAAMASVQPHFRAVGAGLRAHPLHADLHLGNLKWHRGRLSLFDFDDCVIGVPAHDLAVSTYYLRPRAELEAALRDGYVEARPLPVVADAAFESLIAGRNLLLLNELCGTQTADFRAFLPAFLDNTVLKLRAFLDTGVYRHDTPGVVPIA